ncbi:MAG: helicase C-terminal domain-containing protein [Flavonifractor plautii]|nr:helicase C-terminal domain-containing protein [Flavonifractor plautii]MDU6290373.1 helicase C-terminal domain-containing protein [Flavonifractor plautii]MDU6344020.1 helicase C-terminal domain-containing protein [Flavonifractor plautii]
MLSAIPFQLAYSVSIHKVQGLEYNSAKVVILSSNSEQISHGIFYTAITRAKEKLKIF